jgi:hypothetical protein
MKTKTRMKVLPTPREQEIDSMAPTVVMFYVNSLFYVNKLCFNLMVVILKKYYNTLIYALYKCTHLCTNMVIATYFPIKMV